MKIVATQEQAGGKKLVVEFDQEVTIVQRVRQVVFIPTRAAAIAAGNLDLVEITDEEYERRAMEKLSLELGGNDDGNTRDHSAS